MYVAHVCLQVPLGGRSVGAVGALEGLLPGVCAYMSLHIQLAPKPFGTQGTEEAYGGPRTLLHPRRCQHGGIQL